MAKFGIDSNMVFDADGKSVATRLSDHDTSLDGLTTDLAESANKISWVSIENFPRIAPEDEDAPRFQRAIDSLPVGKNGMVYVPDKNDYSFKTGITITDKSNFTLMGTGTSKIQVDTNTVNAITINATSYQRNIMIEGINIFYPIGSSATTGRAITISTLSPAVSIQQLIIRRMRIDNPLSGIYMNSVPLWFSKFEDIEVTGAYESGFTLMGGSASGRFATITLKRCYVNNMRNTNPAFVVKYGYHAYLEACQTDYSSKFGDFLVRGLTLFDCGAEAMDITSLPTNDAMINIVNDTVNGYGVDWTARIKNFHINVDPSLVDNGVKYLIKSTAPLELDGWRSNGGTTGSEEGFTFPQNIKQVYLDGNFYHSVKNVLCTWLKGAPIVVNQGTAILENVTSKIDKIGAVIERGNESSFRAYQSTSQPLTANNFAKVQFQTEIDDNMSEYDSSTSTFTAKVKGRYLVNASVGLTSNTDGNRVILSIYKNGADHTWIFDQRFGAAGTGIANGVGLMTLFAGDTIEIYANTVNTGQSIDNSSLKSYFRIAKI